MKPWLKITIITISTIVIIVATTAIVQAKNKNPKIFYVTKKWKKGERTTYGQTIPPFFIIVTKNTTVTKDHPEGYLTVQKHELEHWSQWQREGLVPYWINYFIELIKHGYRDNKYEVEARKVAGQPD